MQDRPQNIPITAQATVAPVSPGGRPGPSIARNGSGKARPVQGFASQNSWTQLRCGPVGAYKKKPRPAGPRLFSSQNPYFTAAAAATAQATVAPTMGLFPMPIKPIISTCAGTELEPANCASECIRPMVSVMP